MIFIDKLNAAAGKNRSLVCVGLDTSPELIPAGMSVLDFNKAIIDATADLVCAYKPNIAFYEAQGEKGLDTLHKTIALYSERYSGHHGCQEGRYRQYCPGLCQSIIRIYGL